MSYVVKIDDMQKLLSKWKELLAEADVNPEFSYNDTVLKELSQWPRIKWFYYCDNADGNTIRIYDTEHLNHYGGAYYLETNTWSNEHYERVIIRGRRMWFDNSANDQLESQLRDRFRQESPWRLFGARSAPIRPEMDPPDGINVRYSTNSPSSRLVDIQTGTDRDTRLWYFHGQNQYDPPRDSDDIPASWTV